MTIIKYFLGIILLLFLCFSCCPKCKECLLKIKYDWKIPHNGIDIINMQNDTLIGSETYSKSNPNNYGNIQYLKDDGHYLIDKNNGLIIDTIYGFKPKTAEKKYLNKVGQNKIQKFLFETETSQFVLIDNYKGYKIVIEEWYKNIRTSNNHVYNLIVFKGKKQVFRRCLPNIYDFTYDNNSLYLYSDNDIYKFTFDNLIIKK